MKTATNDENSFNDLELSDFDKWAVEQRIKENNRKWLFGRIFKMVIGAIIGLFIAKAMHGG